MILRGRIESCLRVLDKYHYVQCTTALPSARCSCGLHLVKSSLRANWNQLEAERDALAADLAAARALNEAMIANLPGPYYMDPPDGGSVNPEEQMRRLAKDAERYRWIKKQSIKMATAKDDFSCYDADYTVSILFRKRPPSLNGYILVAPQGNELDAAIDAALDKQRSGE